MTNQRGRYTFLFIDQFAASFKGVDFDLSACLMLYDKLISAFQVYDIRERKKLKDGKSSIRACQKRLQISSRILYFPWLRTSTFQALLVRRKTAAT